MGNTGLIDRVKVNDLTGQIIGAAIEVHEVLGPGLLESVYEDCLEIELTQRNLSYERQKQIGLTYKGHSVGANLRVSTCRESGSC